MFVFIYSLHYIKHSYYYKHVDPVTCEICWAHGCCCVPASSLTVGSLLAVLAKRNRQPPLCAGRRYADAGLRRRGGPLAQPTSVSIAQGKSATRCPYRQSIIPPQPPLPSASLTASSVSQEVVAPANLAPYCASRKKRRLKRREVCV